MCRNSRVFEYSLNYLDDYAPKSSLASASARLRLLDHVVRLWPSFLVFYSTLICIFVAQRCPASFSKSTSVGFSENAILMCSALYVLSRIKATVHYQTVLANGRRACAGAVLGSTGRHAPQ